MAKDDIIEITGKVEEVLPGNMFRVKIEQLKLFIDIFTFSRYFIP